MSNQKESKRYREAYSQWIYPVYRHYNMINTRRQQTISPQPYTKLNETIFREKFYDSYQEKEKAFQAILFFANKDLQDRHSLAELKEIPIEEQLEKIKKLTYEEYLQFYRFSTINDDPSIFFPLFTPEQLDLFHQTFQQNWENSISSNAMEKNNFGLFFEHSYVIKSQEENKTIERYYDPDDFRKNNWAKDLHLILKQLKKIGKEEPLLYYEKWLQAKRARAEKRNIPTELKKLEIVEKSFTKRKQKIKEMSEIEITK